MERKLRNRTILRLALVSLVYLMFPSCANIVQPSGGPKDATPPVVQEINPPDQSVNFSSEKIVFEFDEYIQLQDINNQFFISPPLENLPDFIVKNKSLVVTINDTLKPNTTYNINFGDAIRDNNEGNILTNATYAFSTGPYIDSLSLSGTVKNALTLETEKGVLIMLYDEVIDSLPMKKLPTYYTKCSETGSFTLKNLRNGKYKLVALNDKNRNLLFDLSDEEAIGFIDTLVSPIYIPKPLEEDTLSKDSLGVDSLKTSQLIKDTDSLKQDQLDKSAEQSLQVWTFLEEKKTQYLKKSFAPQYGKLAFVYNKGVETLKIHPLNIEIENMGWAFREFSELRDTVYVWLPEAEDEEGTGEIPHVDTIKLEIQADTTKKDTVEIVLKEKGEVEQAGSGRGTGSLKSGMAKQDFKFTLSAPGSGKVQHPNKGFEIRFNHPAIYTDLDQIQLLENSTSVSFKTQPNPEYLRSFLITYPWKADKNYDLFIPPGSLRDLFGLENDSFNVSFKGGNTEEFANLIITLKLPEQKLNYMVQLLNDKGKVIEERYLVQEETLTFALLQPGSYSLRLVQDENNNKKWDTGDYLKQRQPEKIILYPEGKLNIRPNWDLELEWNLLEEGKRRNSE